MPANTPQDADFRVPTISVLICAYTAERLPRIAEAINSLRVQTMPAHEIVLAIDHAPELAAECGPVVS